MWRASGKITAAQNTPGGSVYSGSNGGQAYSYYYNCECEGYTGYSYEYWSATSDYPSYDKNYVQITPNLRVNIFPFIYYSTNDAGNYFSVPFSNIKSSSSKPCNVQNRATKSGTVANISVRITKPAIGSLLFSGPVAKIYLNHSGDPVNPADPPLAIIYLDLNFSVPNNCTVRPGGVINIDLGQSVRATQFKGRAYPLPPKSYTLRNLDLTFDCDFSNADVDVILLGTFDAQRQGFATSSPDISVIVTDDKGAIIPPQSEAGYVSIGDDKISNTLHLKAYPTNSGSEAMPAATSYTSTATIQVSYK